MKKKPASTTTSMTLRAAFQFAMDQPGASVRMGMAPQTMRNLRSDANYGRFPKDSVMRKRLVRAGWRLEVEERWIQVKAPPKKTKRSTGRAKTTKTQVVKGPARTASRAKATLQRVRRGARG